MLTLRQNLSRAAGPENQDRSGCVWDLLRLAAAFDFPKGSGSGCVCVYEQRSCALIVSGPDLLIQSDAEKRCLSQFSFCTFQDLGRVAVFFPETLAVMNFDLMRCDERCRRHLAFKAFARQERRLGNTTARRFASRRPGGRESSA